MWCQVYIGRFRTYWHYSVHFVSRDTGHWTFDKTGFQPTHSTAAQSHLLPNTSWVSSVYLSDINMWANRAKTCYKCIIPPCLILFPLFSDMFRYVYGGKVWWWRPVSQSVLMSPVLGVSGLCLACPAPSNNRIGIDITIIASPELQSWCGLISPPSPVKSEPLLITYLTRSSGGPSNSKLTELFRILCLVFT